MQELETDASKTLKRYRDVKDDEEAELSERMHSKLKIAHPNKLGIYNFQCVIFYQGQVLQFQLSDVFSGGKFAVLFFCSYDL